MISQSLAYITWWVMQPFVEKKKKRDSKELGMVIKIISLVSVFIV